MAKESKTFLEDLKMDKSTALTDIVIMAMMTALWWRFRRVTRKHLKKKIDGFFK